MEKTRLVDVLIGASLASAPPHDTSLIRAQTLALQVRSVHEVYRSLDLAIVGFLLELVRNPRTPLDKLPTPPSQLITTVLISIDPSLSLNAPTAAATALVPSGASSQSTANAANPASASAGAGPGGVAAGLVSPAGPRRAPASVYARQSLNSHAPRPALFVASLAAARFSRPLCMRLLAVHELTEALLTPLPTLSYDAAASNNSATNAAKNTAAAAAAAASAAAAAAATTATAAASATAAGIRSHTRIGVTYGPLFSCHPTPLSTLTPSNASSSSSSSSGVNAAASSRHSSGAANDGAVNNAGSAAAAATRGGVNAAATPTAPMIVTASSATVAASSSSLAAAALALSSSSAPLRRSPPGVTATNTATATARRLARAPDASLLAIRFVWRQALHRLRIALARKRTFFVNMNRRAIVAAATTAAVAAASATHNAHNMANLTANATTSTAMGSTNMHSNPFSPLLSDAAVLAAVATTESQAASRYYQRLQQQHQLPIDDPDRFLHDFDPQLEQAHKNAFFPRAEDAYYFSPGGLALSDTDTDAGTSAFGSGSGGGLTYERRSALTVTSLSLIGGVPPMPPSVAAAVAATATLSPAAASAALAAVLASPYAAAVGTTTTTANIGSGGAGHSGARSSKRGARGPLMLLSAAHSRLQTAHSHLVALHTSALARVLAAGSASASLSTPLDGEGGPAAAAWAAVAAVTAASVAPQPPHPPLPALLAASCPSAVQSHAAGSASAAVAAAAATASAASNPSTGVLVAAGNASAHASYDAAAGTVALGGDELWGWYLYGMGITRKHEGNARGTQGAHGQSYYGYGTRGARGGHGDRGSLLLLPNERRIPRFHLGSKGVGAYNRGDDAYGNDDYDDDDDEDDDDNDDDDGGSYHPRYNNSSQRNNYNNNNKNNDDDDDDDDSARLVFSSPRSRRYGPGLSASHLRTSGVSVYARSHPRISARARAAARAAAAAAATAARLSFTLPPFLPSNAITSTNGNHNNSTSGFGPQQQHLGVFAASAAAATDAGAGSGAVAARLAPVWHVSPFLTPNKHNSASNNSSGRTRASANSLASILSGTANATGGSSFGAVAAAAFKSAESAIATALSGRDLDANSLLALSQSAAAVAAATEQILSSKSLETKPPRPDFKKSDDPGVANVYPRITLHNNSSTNSHNNNTTNTNTASANVSCLFSLAVALAAIPADYTLARLTVAAAADVDRRLGLTPAPAQTAATTDSASVKSIPVSTGGSRSFTAGSLANPVAVASQAPQVTSSAAAAAAATAARVTAAGGAHSLTPHQLASLYTTANPYSTATAAGTMTVGGSRARGNPSKAQSQSSSNSSFRSGGNAALDGSKQGSDRLRGGADLSDSGATSKGGLRVMRARMPTLPRPIRSQNVSTSVSVANCNSVAGDAALLTVADVSAINSGVPTAPTLTQMASGTATNDGSASNADMQLLLPAPSVSSTSSGSNSELSNLLSNNNAGSAGNALASPTATTLTLPGSVSGASSGARLSGSQLVDASGKEWVSGSEVLTQIDDDDDDDDLNNNNNGDITDYDSSNSSNNSGIIAAETRLLVSTLTPLPAFLLLDEPRGSAPAFPQCGPTHPLWAQWAQQGLLTGNILPEPKGQLKGVSASVSDPLATAMTLTSPQHTLTFNSNSTSNSNYKNYVKKTATGADTKKRKPKQPSASTSDDVSGNTTNEVAVAPALTLGYLHSPLRDVSGVSVPSRTNASTLVSTPLDSCNGNAATGSVCGGSTSLTVSAGTGLTVTLTRTTTVNTESKDSNADDKAKLGRPQTRTCTRMYTQKTVTVSTSSAAAATAIGNDDAAVNKATATTAKDLTVMPTATAAQLLLPTVTALTVAGAAAAHRNTAQTATGPADCDCEQRGGLTSASSAASAADDYILHPAQTCRHRTYAAHFLERAAATADAAAATAASLAAAGPALLTRAPFAAALATAATAAARDHGNLLAPVATSLIAYSGGNVNSASAAGNSINVYSVTNTGGGGGGGTLPLLPPPRRFLTAASAATASPAALQQHPQPSTRRLLRLLPTGQAPLAGLAALSRRLLDTFILPGTSQLAEAAAVVATAAASAAANNDPTLRARLDARPLDGDVPDAPLHYLSAHHLLSDCELQQQTPESLAAAVMGGRLNIAAILEGRRLPRVLHAFSPLRPPSATSAAAAAATAAAAAAASAAASGGSAGIGAVAVGAGAAATVAGANAAAVAALLALYGINTTAANSPSNVDGARGRGGLLSGRRGVASRNAGNTAGAASAATLLRLLAAADVVVPGNSANSSSSAADAEVGGVVNMTTSANNVNTSSSTSGAGVLHKLRHLATPPSALAAEDSSSASASGVAVANEKQQRLTVFGSAPSALSTAAAAAVTTQSHAVPAALAPVSRLYPALTLMHRRARSAALLARRSITPAAADASECSDSERLSDSAPESGSGSDSDNEEEEEEEEDVAPARVPPQLAAAGAVTACTRLGATKAVRSALATARSTRMHLLRAWRRAPSSTPQNGQTAEGTADSALSFFGPVAFDATRLVFLTPGHATTLHALVTAAPAVLLRARNSADAQSSLTAAAAAAAAAAVASSSSGLYYKSLLLGTPAPRHVSRSLWELRIGRALTTFALTRVWRHPDLTSQGRLNFDHSRPNFGTAAVITGRGVNAFSNNKDYQPTGLAWAVYKMMYTFYRVCHALKQTNAVTATGAGPSSANVKEQQRRARQLQRRRARAAAAAVSHAILLTVTSGCVSLSYSSVDASSYSSTLAAVVAVTATDAAAILSLPAPAATTLKAVTAELFAAAETDAFALAPAAAPAPNGAALALPPLPLRVSQGQLAWLSWAASDLKKKDSNANAIVDSNRSISERSGDFGVSVSGPLIIYDYFGTDGLCPYTTNDLHNHANSNSSSAKRNVKSSDAVCADSSAAAVVARHHRLAARRVVTAALRGGTGADLFYAAYLQSSQLDGMVSAPLDVPEAAFEYDDSDCDEDSQSASTGTIMNSHSVTASGVTVSQHVIAPSSITAIEESSGHGCGIDPFFPPAPYHTDAPTVKQHHAGASSVKNVPSARGSLSVDAGAGQKPTALASSCASSGGYLNHDAIYAAAADSDDADSEEDEAARARTRARLALANSGAHSQLPQNSTSGQQQAKAGAALVKTTTGYLHSTNPSTYIDDIDADSGDDDAPYANPAQPSLRLSAPLCHRGLTSVRADRTLYARCVAERRRRRTEGWDALSALLTKTVSIGSEAEAVVANASLGRKTTSLSTTTARDGRISRTNTAVITVPAPVVVAPAPAPAPAPAAASTGGWFSSLLGFGSSAAATALPATAADGDAAAGGGGGHVVPGASSDNSPAPVLALLATAASSLPFPSLLPRYAPALSLSPALAALPALAATTAHPDPLCPWYQTTLVSTVTPPTHRTRSASSSSSNASGSGSLAAALLAVGIDSMISATLGPAPAALLYQAAVAAAAVGAAAEDAAAAAAAEGRSGRALTATSDSYIAALSVAAALAPRQLGIDFALYPPNATKTSATDDNNTMHAASANVANVVAGGLGFVTLTPSLPHLLFFSRDRVGHTVPAPLGASFAVPALAGALTLPTTAAGDGGISNGCGHRDWVSAAEADLERCHMVLSLIDPDHALSQAAGGARPSSVATAIQDNNARAAASAGGKAALPPLRRAPAPAKGVRSRGAALVRRLHTTRLCYAAGWAALDSFDTVAQLSPLPRPPGARAARGGWAGDWRCDGDALSAAEAHSQLLRINALITAQRARSLTVTVTADSSSSSSSSSNKANASAATVRVPVAVPVFYHASAVHLEVTTLVLARHLFSHAPGGGIDGVPAATTRAVSRLPLLVALAHHGFPAPLARLAAAFPELAQRTEALWMALDLHRAATGATLGEVMAGVNNIVS